MDTQWVHGEHIFGTQRAHGEHMEGALRGHSRRTVGAQWVYGECTRGAGRAVLQCKRKMGTFRTHIGRTRAHLSGQRAHRADAMVGSWRVHDGCVKKAAWWDHGGHTPQPAGFSLCLRICFDTSDIMSPIIGICTLYDCTVHPPCAYCAPSLVRAGCKTPDVKVRRWRLLRSGSSCSNISLGCRRLRG